MSLVLSGTTGLSDVDGSAATPAIRGTDANTGIFFPAADTIAFAEGGAEIARFDSSGNLGIGTSSPTVKLHVANSGVPVAGFYRDLDVTVVGTAGQSIEFGARNGSTFTPGASVIGFLDNPATTGGLQFYTRSSGTLTERARIDSSGNFLVNRTSGIYSTTKFEVKGAASQVAACLQIGTDGFAAWSWRNASASEVGYISINSGSVNYATSSDYRLKHDIAPMTGALAKVAQLKPVTYKWNSDNSESQGFIAHELQEVVPECVTGEKDAVDADNNPQYQGIDTSFLVATLTAAIQEQQAIIQSLTDRITALETA